MYHISYHGTHRNSAKIMVGPPPKIRVDLGKGELGQGFYTGSSPSLARSWAFEKHKSDAVVIMIMIPMEDFLKLDAHTLKTHKEVNDLWNRLIKDNETDSFKSGKDYIVAPLATIEQLGFQHKFESEDSEIVINTSVLKIYSCV